MDPSCQTAPIQAPQCPPHCPNIGQNTTPTKNTWWEITFNNNAILYVSSNNPNIDPLDKWRKGQATYKDKAGKLLTAQSARKL